MADLQSTTVEIGIRNPTVKSPVMAEALTARVGASVIDVDL